MRVLIIEDNIELADTMVLGLQNHGYSVDCAYSGDDGEEKAYINEYDTILLDLNLPDKDGLEILKTIREEDNHVPVIIITARDEVEDRALGLDLGADDYLVKPIQLLELRARVAAVIRRSNGRSSSVIQIGKLFLDPKSRVAHVENNAVPLSAKEFDILEYISSKHPSVVSSEEIIEHVYNEDFDPFSSVLRVHLARVRKKLAEAAGYNMLETMRGKGYYLCEK